MFRALITTIPFQRIPAQSNPEWNHLPRAIIHDITSFIHLERLFYPNKPPLYNIKPFIHMATGPMHYSIDSIPILEFKPLTKYNHSYLIDTFSRDLSVNFSNNPDNNILVSRYWIDYNQNSKLLQILSVQEIFDYHLEFSAFIKYLRSTRCIPRFSAGDLNHTTFLEQLQRLN